MSFCNLVSCIMRDTNEKPFKIFIFILSVYMYVSMREHATGVQVPVESRRGCQSPQNWSYELPNVDAEN